MAEVGEKLKVFISYSRRDSAEFADELLAGLEAAGFAPFLDRHDIVPGEPWEARLGGLIEESDTVVFVVSPEAVKSEQCTWEVDRTIEVSKRLLPVIFKSVPDDEVPEKLRRLQFVRFDSSLGLRPLSQLAEALRVDLQWIREHTRLGELAKRWDQRGGGDRATRKRARSNQGHCSVAKAYRVAAGERGNLARGDDELCNLAKL